MKEKILYVKRIRNKNVGKKYVVFDINNPDRYIYMVLISRVIYPVNNEYYDYENGRYDYKIIGGTWGEVGVEGSIGKKYIEAYGFIMNTEKDFKYLQEHLDEYKLIINSMKGNENK